MGDTILHGNPPIAVVLRRSAQARRLSLRVSRLDGRVTLTMPRGVPERQGLAFLREREEWLRGHLADVAGVTVVGLGSQVPFRGQMLAVQGADIARTRLIDGALLVPDDAGRAGARAQAFLRLRARDHLAEASDRYAAQLGRPYGRISLRDTRSRWGSCSSAGDLMYSWRLIMAPPEVLEYVAAHEVAHLAEMNHSPDFWAVVARLFPAHKRCRAWLRTHGQGLHSYRFGD
jgi:predicted metal-dependent hydrolase